MMRHPLYLSLLLFIGCQVSEDPRIIAERQRLAELGNQMAFVREAGYEPESVNASSEAAAAQQVVDAQNQFAIDLYRQLSANNGNLFFSPSSISLALSMAMAGADGATLEEMANSLHYAHTDETLYKAIAAIQPFLGATTADHGIELNIANAMWGDQRLQFAPQYSARLQNDFGATLRNLDFRNSQASRQTINDWVSLQTKNRIQELIPQGAIHSDTGLVLTNAIYFYGKWTDPFAKSATKPDKFSASPGEPSDISMMHRTDPFLYAETDEVKLLQLPYGDKTFSMLLILPTTKHGLASLEANLSLEQLKNWKSNLIYESEVIVSIPKFKSESEFELSSILKALGIHTAFDEQQADFSKITEDERLFISQVIHKSFVEVNESGTEAAAATGVIMATASAPVEKKEPLVFRADHPFIYLIQDNRTDQIVFMGRLSAP